MALLLVVGLLAADVVTYASVRSFLYGQADNTLAQNEALGFNYLTFAAGRHGPVTGTGSLAPGLVRRVPHPARPHGQVSLRRPSGSPTHPDPAPILTKGIPVQQVPDIYRPSGSGATPAPSVPTPTR